jgi:hypothetical protein
MSSPKHPSPWIANIYAKGSIFFKRAQWIHFIFLEFHPPTLFSKARDPINQREKQGLLRRSPPGGEIDEKHGPQRFSRWFILVYLLCRGTVNPKRDILKAMIVRRLHRESLIIV